MSDNPGKIPEPGPLPAGGEPGGPCPEAGPEAARNGSGNGKISQKRLDANRRNAQKSTGPRTAEGKARSRQNALKHGLSGAGIVVHPDDADLLRARLEAWTEDLDPEDRLEGWLVGRAALASVRLDRCARVERGDLHRREADVLTQWATQRRTEVDSVAAPIDTRPAQTVAALLASSFGCSWLLGQWRDLNTALASRGRWSTDELMRALRLLGEEDTPTVQSSERLQRFWLAGLAVEATFDPDDFDDFCCVSNTGLTAEQRSGELRKLLPDPAAARAHLQGFVAEEVARLDARLQECWDGAEARLRKQVTDSVGYDDSPAADRMLRYERANASELHRCLNLFFRKRAAEARAQRSENEPTGARLESAAAAGSAPAAPPAPAAGPAAEPVSADGAAVMPRGLSERLAGQLDPAGAQPAAAMVAAAPSPEIEPTVTMSQTARLESSACAQGPPPAAPVLGLTST